MKINNMKITSQKGINLLKEFEGLKLKSYLCSAGVETIGYGTTILPNGVKVPKGSTCTIQEAEMFLKRDLEYFERGVNRYVTVPINQNQFDALVCFAYNVGLGALQQSSLLRKININPNDETLSEIFLAYSKASGESNKKDDDNDGLIDEKGEKQTLLGLERRRKAEYKLYETDI